MLSQSERPHRTAKDAPDQPNTIPDTQTLLWPCVNKMLKVKDMTQNRHMTFKETLEILNSYVRLSASLLMSKSLRLTPCLLHLGELATHCVHIQHQKIPHAVTTPDPLHSSPTLAFLLLHITAFHCTSLLINLKVLYIIV